MQKQNLLNEFADLSQRLEHLVSYSSQMVFISGEQMGDQKKFVEAFLGARHNSLDVIYLTGNSFHNEDDVRQEFAKQVVGTSPSLDLPLLQLVATRENRDTPLLIAITRAERIPDQILQELWDLVLQTRFARNQQQINILLFGEHEWAERTKAWLPTNNNDKPVLLTSETVEMQSEQEIEGDLDAFINAKRKEFNDRLKARSLEYEPPSSVLSNWWVRLLAVCAFIVCFSGLLIWQYFDLTQSAVKDFTQFLFQTESTTPADDWEEAKALLAETDALQPENIAVPQNAPKESNTTVEDTAIHKEAPSSKTASTFVTSWQEESTKLERRAIPLNLKEEATAPKKVEVSSNANQQENFNTNAGGMELYESESLVNVSTEKLKRLQPQAAPASTASAHPNEAPLAASANSQPDNSSNGNTPTPSNSSEPTVITEPLIPNELASTLNKKNASQVEFVGPPRPAHLANTSIPQQPSQTPNSTIQEESTPATALNLTPNTDFSQENAFEETIIEEAAVEDYPIEESVAQTDAADYPVEDIVTLEDLVAAEASLEAIPATPPAPNYLFNETALMALPDSQYLLQVSGISSREVLNQYLADNQLSDKVWVYKTQRYGGDWFVVLFNKAYPSLNEARNSVNELPQTTRQSAPFAKSIATIRQEINQGYPVN